MSEARGAIRTPGFSPVAKLLVAGLAVVGIAVGCPGPVATSSKAAEPIVGSVEFPAGRATQATLEEIASAATVSLIDPSLNQTVATSVTDASGHFLLSFSAGFQPSGSPYYLEAVKGLSAGGTPNRAGAPAARIRTLIQWGGTTGWRSISAGSNTVSVTTTGLCIVASYKSTPASLLALVGSLAMGTGDASLAPATPDTFSPGGTGITNVEFHRGYELAWNALTLDQDPFQAVYQAPDGTFQRLAPGLAVIRVNPGQAAIGSAVTVVGHNFSSTAANNTVIFGGGVSATPTAVNSDRTQLTVTVPAGAGSGPVTVRTMAGELDAIGGFLRISSAPLAGTRFLGLNAGTGGNNAGDFGVYFRIMAQQASTRVTLRSLTASGSIDWQDSRTLATVGSAWEANVVNDRLNVFQILSDKPVSVTYDSMAPGHASDDEWACQTGTDYYFRVPGSFGGYQLISHGAGNNVTVTCLTDSSLNWSQAMGDGVANGRNTMPTAATSYWFRVQSSLPTTTIFGLFSDNASTQVFSADMQSYYEAHSNAGSQGGYQLVGWEDDTNVTVTNLVTGGYETFTLAAGDHISRLFSTGGIVRNTAVSNRPVGFYINDNGWGFENNQFSSADFPGSIGRLYRIVSPSRDATTIYLASTTAGNTVTLSGAITGTYKLGELEWVDAGSLAADSVLTIASTYPIAVFSSDGRANEHSYTLLPY